MSGPVDLTALAVGQRLQDPLLVHEVEQRTSDGGPFTVLTLGNSTGRIATAPFWLEDQPKVAGVERGHVVQVIGEVGLYRERQQLRVSSIRVLPAGSVAWRDLVPSVGDVAPFWEVLDRWRAEIRGPRLAATLGLFYEDAEFRRRYEECPASTSGHHAQMGGLLKHTAEMAAIGRAIAKASRADIDLVLAGVLLHDMGKLEAYRWDGVFQMTPRGALYGHVVLGSLLLDRVVGRADPCPCTPEELDLLHHLVLSHHGRPEFGAPVSPMTLEAEILHFADNASAKAASMSDALADLGNFSGDDLVSARTLWQLDRRRVYRGRSDWGRGEGA